MAPPWLLALLLASVQSVPLTEECGYKNCPRSEEGVLNVHIVAHSHDDVGWLKTVDQYYYGSRNRIQKAGVQYILDSVVKELLEDPSRKFIYVETAFFWKWWVAQRWDTQRSVSQLVEEGRLVFVGGAWAMNDEAAAHYHSTVDQFTWGLSKINTTFGACALPRAGWQIDPFGHSREFASLLAQMGYEGLLLGRVDYQDKAARRRRRAMEMLWRGDDDLGAASDIFTGILHNTYSPPPGFCFDVLCDDEPIIDDVASPMYNVDDKVTYFIDYVRNAARSYVTDNVLITMGGDFTYQDANMWYTSLDKLIEYTNLKAAKERLNIKLFYSTPNCYLKAIQLAKPTLPIKQDDFFPYASDAHSYWTGYFTSRPTTKYFERQGNGYLQAAKQLQVLGNLRRDNEVWLNNLKSAMGIMQHHDAITGTEKQHVAHDYVRILDSALDYSLTIPREAFNKVLQNSSAAPFSFERCRLNESRCHSSEDSRRLVVTLYNPVAWSMKEPVRVPVRAGRYEVYAPNGDKIDSQVVEIPKAIQEIPTRESNATHEVVFIAYLKGLKYKSFYIQQIPDYDENIHNNKDSTIVKRSAQTKIDLDKIETYFQKKSDLNNHLKQLEEYSLNNMPNAENIKIPEKYFKAEETINYDQIIEQTLLPEQKQPKSTEQYKFEQYIDEPSALQMLRNKALSNKDENYQEGFIYNKDQNTNIDESIPENEQKYPKIDVKLPEIEPIDQTYNINQDKYNIDKNIVQANRIAEQREKMGDAVRGREKGYELSSDELRMLSDDPNAGIVTRLDDFFVVKNEFIKLQVDNTSGGLRSVSFEGHEANLSIAFGYYPGEIGNNEIASNRSSGAYILRSKTDQPIMLSPQRQNVVYGNVVQEVQCTWSDNAYFSARVYKGLGFLEVDWVVGPIDVDDGVGKEYIIKYQSNIFNNGEFYTDSNGRQIIKRKLNQRPQWNLTLAEHVGGNYYPITNQIYIQNDKEKISVLTDRSEGGSSLQEGEIELMLHRRLLHDDAFGVGEALNETVDKKGLVVRGTQKLIITNKDTDIRKEVIQNDLKPLVFISNADNLELKDWLKLKNCYSWVKSLPEGIHLLTIEPWGEQLLLRLENYLKGKVIEVDLAEIFTDINVKGLKEKMLSGFDLGKKIDWNVEEEFSKSFNEEGFGEKKMAEERVRERDNGLKIKLRGMEIRTFIVDYEYV